MQAIPFLIDKHLPSENVNTLITSNNIAYLFSNHAFDIDSTVQISNFEKYFERISNNNSKDNFLHPEQIASILCSSGSTGIPKQCCHLLKHHLNSAAAVNKKLNLKSNNTWLLNLPLFHVSGLSILFRVLSIGACIYLGKHTPYPELIDSSISHMSLVPTQLVDLLDALPQNNFKNLNSIIVGGAGTDKKLLLRAILAKYPIRLTYGMSEVASQISLSDVYMDTDNITSGKVLDHCEVTQVNNLLHVKSSALFEGYYENGIVTLPLSEDGFFNTNDLGSIDTNHHLIVNGRLDNMFVSGGENIYPEEIERVISTHPKVEFSVICPLPHDRYGNVGVAFLKLNAELERDELSLYLNSQIQKYKIPKQYYIFPNDFSFHSKTVRKQLANLLLNSNGLKPI